MTNKSDEEVALGKWDGIWRPTWVACPYCESIAAHDYRTWHSLTTHEVSELHGCGACGKEWWMEVVSAEGGVVPLRKRRRPAKGAE